MYSIRVMIVAKKVYMYSSRLPVDWSQFYLPFFNFQFFKTNLPVLLLLLLLLLLTPILLLCISLLSKTKLGKKHEHEDQERHEACGTWEKDDLFSSMCILLYLVQRVSGYGLVRHTFHTKILLYIHAYIHTYILLHRMTKFPQKQI